jgi:hypothetical protein
MYKKIVFVFALAALVSCKKTIAEDSDADSAKNEKDKIRTAHWLLGKWETPHAGGTLTENWKKANDSTYNGLSYFIKGKDTIHSETILLQQVEDQLSYNSTIKGQDDDQPISFTLAGRNETELVFENLQHNYPQKISYTQISKDSLITEISGMQSGKLNSEKYIMLRTTSK